MPLQTTLRITTDMLHLAAQMFQASCGPVPATKNCEVLGDLLLECAGVTHAPYIGVMFEESKCHRIGRKLTLVCKFLDEYALPRWAVRYRRELDDWKALLPTLNRSETITAHDADKVERRTFSFVDGLRASLYWLSVTPDMHFWFSTPLPSYDGFSASGAAVSRSWRHIMVGSIKKLLSTRPGPCCGPIVNSLRRWQSDEDLVATCTTTDRRGSPLGRGSGRPRGKTMVGCAPKILNEGFRESRQRASRRTRKTMPSGRQCWPRPPPAASGRRRRIRSGVQSLSP